MVVWLVPSVICMNLWRSDHFIQPSWSLSARQTRYKRRELDGNGTQLADIAKDLQHFVRQVGILINVNIFLHCCSRQRVADCSIARVKLRCISKHWFHLFGASQRNAARGDGRQGLNKARKFGCRHYLRDVDIVSAGLYRILHR